jgi:beta-glucosidase
MADLKITPAIYANQAADLVGQMTLSEKASLCSGKNFWQLKSIERLGLSRIMVTDGPHGLRKQVGKADHLGLNSSVPATCFPTSSAMAASWDRNLLLKIGEALGAECAKEDVAVLLGPGVNIKRHPTCGRNFEYFSEDPLLSGESAAALINGVQSQNVGTSLKHFAANNQEQSRMVIDTIVDERTLREIYLAAFEIAVKKSQPWTVMCSYNRLDGIYCSEHNRLLNEILRDEWGFEGFVVTDWGAQNNRVEGLSAGLDLEMPGSGRINDQRIVDAVTQGQLPEETVERAAKRIVQVILAAQGVRESDHQVDHDAHHALAQRAAEESAVLLKNDNNVLPFKPTGTLAVIGGFAEEPRYQGGGSSHVNPYRLDRPIDALRTYLDGQAEVIYAQGFDPRLAPVDEDLIVEAVEVARSADQVLILAGLPSAMEAEGADREHLRLPEQINTLIEAVLQANPNAAIALSNGSPVELPWIDQAPAVLELHLAGQAGANALPRLIFGDVSPSGKLAETFPLQMSDCASDPHFPGHPKQVVYREGLNVGYRYFDTLGVPVLFPFGHGLSFSSFDYGELTLSSSSIVDDEPLTASLTITNTGTVEAAEIVQIYVRDKESTLPRPDKELRDFAKVHLKPGESQTLSFTLTRRAFAFYDVASADWQIESGTFEILAAASVADVRSSADLVVNSAFVCADVPQIENQISMTDQDMAALGSPVPEPQPIRPFHVNSTIDDLRYSWLGRRVHKVILSKIRRMSDENDDEETAAIMDSLIRGMPLRNIVAMSGGAISQKSLDALILLMNGQPLAALRRLEPTIKG